ncbi:hypothetical protein [Gemmatimonas sp.]|uniref:hypothetical protein n=1 Tax=Gemmatimonas sp. TaxID=1962908 RepID=UPI00286E35FA|nr:hypothetical protein [Gemmatimonas sp.]
MVFSPPPKPWDPKPGKLNFYADSWKLQAKVCPCDLQFADFLAASGRSGSMVFHFGTGEHHLLAKENQALSEPNEILGITASLGEYEAYVDYVINEPQAAKYYKVLFADIYTLTPRMLPKFDVVSLFHLCEFYNVSNAEYAPLDDTSLVELFLATMNPGGELLFYTGSFAYAKAQPIIERFVDQGRLIKKAEYEQLLIYAAG